MPQVSEHISLCYALSKHMLKVPVLLMSTIVLCRCVELQGCTLKQQEEIEVIKKQLLAVIQQKIKLHEQIEAWQVRG